MNIRYLLVIAATFSSLTLSLTSHAAALSTFGALYSAYGISGTPYVFDQGTTSIDTSLAANGVADGLAAGATYAGTTQAIADYGTLKTYIDVSVENYTYDSFIWVAPTPDGIGINQGGIAGSVAARIDDTFTVNALVNGIMNFSFTIDGTISNNVSTSNINVINETTFTSGASPSPFGGNWSYKEIYTTNQTKTINLTIPYIANQSTDVWFELSSFIEVWDDSYFSTPSDPTYNFSVLADFFNTATLSEILITNEIGTPIKGATIDAVSGANYQLSDLNAVPIPSAVLLFGTGMLGLVGMARRKKAA